MLFWDQSILDARNLVLPRRVRYKKRNYNRKKKLSSIPNYRFGRTHIFHCNPYVSNQKGRLEKNHEFIRYVIPKGRSTQKYRQEDITLLCNHINSLSRDSLNGNCPFDLANLLINQKVLTSLGLKKVSPDEILLKPTLLK